MLSVTLYKNCILNENYQEVFSLGTKTGDTENVLENYLSNLDSITIQINAVYYEQEGELIFEREVLENQIYDFNYMKILAYNDDGDELIWKRYCFVNDIKIKHGCVYLDYKEDIWSSYVDKVQGIINSYLISSRIKEYSNREMELQYLPTEYDGVNPLKIENIQSDISPLNDKVQVIAEIQDYKLVSAATPQQNRNVNYFMFVNYTWTQLDNTRIIVPNSMTGARYDLSDAINLILNLCLHVQDGYVRDGREIYNSANDLEQYGRRYEIGNIYIIPAKFQIMYGNLNNRQIHFYTGEYQNHVHPWERLNGFAEEIDTISTFDNQYSKCFEKEIENNYKLKSIGTLNHSINIINLGKSHIVQLYVLKNLAEFGLYLSLDNQLIEITDDFKFEIPFEVLRSEQLSQRAIGLYLKRLSNLQSISNNYFKNQTFKNDAIASFLDMYSGASSGKIGSFTKGVKETGEMWETHQENAIDFASNINRRKLISSPVYSNSKGIFSNNLTIMNSYYGIMTFSIVPSNENYVKESINKYGYYVIEYIKNINDLDLFNVDYFSSEEINYNVIKFIDANLYGSFPRNIAIKLNAILNNGVKIWYNESLEEDNYVV